MVLFGPDTMAFVELISVQFAVWRWSTVLMLLVLSRYSVTLADDPVYTLPHWTWVVSFCRFAS